MDVIDTSALSTLATDIEALATELEGQPTGAAQLAADQEALATALVPLQEAFTKLSDIVNPPPPATPAAAAAADEPPADPAPPAPAAPAAPTGN